MFHGITHPFTIPNTAPAFVVRGGASVSELESTFTYEVHPDLTVIIDDTTVLGKIVKGGGRVGQPITDTNVPRLIGKISEHLQTIALTQEDLVVEEITFHGVAPDGATIHDVVPRICHRERTLL